MVFRSVRLNDAARLLKIYTPFVTNTADSFELEPPTLAEFEQRITDTTNKYPWLVAEVDVQIAGYSYACEYRSREAYKSTCEFSAYVDPAFLRQGIVPGLYDLLFHEVKKM